MLDSRFAIESPYLFTLVAMIASTCALSAIGMVVTFVFNTWNRFMRHLNIRSKGWPPNHCDADGDFLQQESGAGR